MKKMSITKRKKKGATSYEYKCSSMKFCFATKKRAKTYITSELAKANDERRVNTRPFRAMYIYKCPECHYYHLTSSAQGKKELGGRADKRYN